MQILSGLIQKDKTVCLLNFNTQR